MLNLPTGTVAIDENYSEPYNVKNKKLLPNHQYDVVTGMMTTSLVK